MIDIEKLNVELEKFTLEEVLNDRLTKSEDINKHIENYYDKLDLDGYANYSTEKLLNACFCAIPSICSQLSPHYNYGRLTY